ncbi:hypothetical protein L2E82_47410 [Cichorium intybus]|uniref:Uncharacterized protein n=1 Tax=Cichorium intybus TaxID=13427 RepID=A0ACB8YVY3_CICIN|nr:hypothetical protein L2E82_47410 [Cichorium intybus]
MADVLELLVMNVLFDDASVDDLSISEQMPHGREPRGEREWRGNLDCLMNHLKTIMLGYENEKAQGLLEEMEIMALEVTRRKDFYMDRDKIIMQGLSIEQMVLMAHGLTSSHLGNGWRDKMLSMIEELCDLEFPNIRSLEHLQKLKLLNTIPFPEPTRSCNPLIFPEKLKKLTLSNTGLDWEEMWTFAWLPNLEVLKLRVHACIGEKWETSDSEFQRLKVLKLHDLDLRQWVSSSHNFPRLQRLLVHRCLNLESIPSDLGKILTLDMIHVSGCSASAESSALEIQKEQESEGNYFLKAYTSKNL